MCVCSQQVSQRLSVPEKRVCDLGLPHRHTRQPRLWQCVRSCRFTFGWPRAEPARSKRRCSAPFPPGRSPSCLVLSSETLRRRRQRRWRPRELPAVSGTGSLLFPQFRHRSDVFFTDSVQETGSEEGLQRYGTKSITNRSQILSSGGGATLSSYQSIKSMARLSIMLPHPFFNTKTKLEIKKNVDVTRNV